MKELIINISRFQSRLSRRLDSNLNGISLNELIIMNHIQESPSGKMRRIDLAEKIGLTASGITRLLLPMEKIGLIKRESDKNDARVSYVSLASGGQEKLQEGLERLEIFTEEIIGSNKPEKIKEINKIIKELDKNI
jgi:DNA-binding MarR family transcriptional regulator